MKLKRFLSALSLLLALSSPCLAAEPFDVAWMNAAIVGGGSAAAACSPTYAKTENFEGAGICYTGDVTYTNCTNSFGKSGTFNFKYATAPAPMEGSYSLLIDESGGLGYASLSVTAGDNYYVQFMFSVPVLPAAYKDIFSWRSSSTAKGRIQVSNTGAVRVYNGTKYASTVGTLTAGTVYYIQAGYTKGIGTDGTGYVAWSTTSTLPTSGNNYASIANGDANSQIDTLYFGAGASAVSFIYDRIRVSASDMCTPSP